MGLSINLQKMNDLNDIPCPRCDCSGSAEIILHHFHLDHPELVLYYGSSIPVLLENDFDENMFLYVDDRSDLLAWVNYTYTNIDEDFKVFTFDAQIFMVKTQDQSGRPVKVTQSIELYSLSNNLQWRSEEKVCQPWGTDEFKQEIDVNLVNHDYPRNAMLCKVFLPEIKNKKELKKCEQIAVANLFSPDVLRSDSPIPTFDFTSPVSETLLTPWANFLSSTPILNNTGAASPTPDTLLQPLANLISSSPTHETSFTCTQCGLTCKSNAGLSSHLRAHQRAMDGGQNNRTAAASTKTVVVEEYQCRKCDKICKSLAGLASHHKAHQRVNTNDKEAETKSTNIFTCPECSQVCKSRAGLSSHMRAHERASQSQPPKKSTVQELPCSSTSAASSDKLKCSYCGIICKSGAGLSSHVRAHERASERQQPTAKANVQGPSRNLGAAKPLESETGLVSLLRAHERSHSQQSIGSIVQEPPSTPQFICEECGMTCKSGAGLSSHLRAHQRRSPATTSNIPSEMLGGYGGRSGFGGGRSCGVEISFGGGGGYSCSICGRSCASGAGLSSHMRAHARRC